MQRKLLSGSVVGLATSAALIAAVLPASAAAAGPGEGSAYGASADLSLLPGVLGGKGISLDTGKLAPSSTDGKTGNTAADAELKKIAHAKAITSSSKHDSESGGVTSNAKVVGATLPLLKGAAGSTPKASVISSECESTDSGVTGSSDLANLDLGKLGQVDADTPNLKLGVPGVVQVIANEQIKHDDGSLTVNALHIKLLGGKATGALGDGNVVLASSTCGKASESSGGGDDGGDNGGDDGGHDGGGNGGNQGGGDNGGGDNGGAAETPQPAAPGSQVSVVPEGAPETGDGSYAAKIAG